MHLHCFVADTLVLEILVEPQDLPSVADACVLTLPDGMQRFRVRRLVRTYGFARALVQPFTRAASAWQGSSPRSRRPASSYCCGAAPMCCVTAWISRRARWSGLRR